MIAPPSLGRQSRRRPTNSICSALRSDDNQPGSHRNSKSRMFSHLRLALYLSLTTRWSQMRYIMHSSWMAQSPHGAYRHPPVPSTREENASWISPRVSNQPLLVSQED